MCIRDRYQPPHSLAPVVHDREDDDTWVIDIGCGRGRDARWLAKQGRRCVGLDFSSVAMDFIRGRAAEQGWPLELHTMNLLELRQVLAWGALLGARPGPRSVLARHVIDSVPPHGVDYFWRLVRMALPDGGRVHLEFLTAPIDDPEGRPSLTIPLDPADVVADIERRGAHVSGRHDLMGEPVDYGYGEEVGAEMELPTCRLEVEWPGAWTKESL